MSNEIMKCPLESGRAELLLEFSAERLGPHEREPLARHIAGCPDCQEWTIGQAAVWSVLDTWTPEPVSSDFDAKLLARIADLDQGSVWTRWSWAVRGWLVGTRGWGPAVPVGAACLTVAIGLWIQNPWPAEPVQSATFSVETRDLEQAERALEDMEMLRVFDAVAEDTPGGQPPGGQPL